MKRVLIIISLLLALVYAQAAPTIGDIAIYQWTSDGWHLRPLTPVANKVVGFDGSAGLGVINGATWGRILGTLGDQSDLTAALLSKTPISRQINGHALTSDFSLAVSDITGAVPTARTINGYALSGNVTLTKSDIGLGSVSNALQLAASNDLSDLASAATARVNLGLVIGTNVQAYNATLAAIAAGTYTGATSQTTLGTITTGVWNGTPIANTYIASAATWNAKQNALTAGTDYLTPSGNGSLLTGLNASALSSGLVPISLIPIGTTSSTVTIGNDARLSDARTPTAHASTHASGGSDPITISESQVTSLVSHLAAKAASATTLSGYGITDQSALQTETVTYVANVRAAGGDVGQTTIQALDQFIVDLKRDSLWTLFVEVYPFCGTNLSAALVKLKYGSVSSLTNNGFTSADYSQEGGFGVTSGNTSKFLNTGFVPSTYGISCANITMVGTCTNDNVVASASSGTIFSTLKTGNAAGGQIVYGQTPSGAGIQTVDADEQGVSNSTCAINCFAANSTTHHGNRNGVRTHFWSQTSSTTLPDEVGLFKGCFSGSNNRYSNGVVGTCMFGTYLTPTQLKLVAKAVYKLERALGRTAYQYKPTLVWNGDSITSGQGATNWYEAFHMIVSRQLGMLNFNVAQPAAWASSDAGPIGGVSSSGDIVATLPPSAAVVMYGTNDMGYSVTSGTYTTAITSIINNYVSNRWRVILCTAPYVNNNNSSLRRSFAVAAAGIAKTNKIPFVDCDRIFTDLGTAENTLGSYMTDGTHPNTAGHALIADRIKAAFEGRMIRRLTLTFTSVALSSTNTQTVEVLNAVAGNTVTVTPNSPSAGIIYSGTVTSNDTVTVSTTNITAGALTPTAGLVTIEVR